MSNKDVIFVTEDTASLVMVPVKAVTADLVTEAGVTVYVPLATTENPGVVQIGEGLKITDEGLLSVNISDISAGIIVKHNDGIINENAKAINFTNTFEVTVDPETFEVKIDGSNTLNRIVNSYDDDYVFLINSFNDYYDKTYIDNLIIDNLETDSSIKALSAKQGVVLKDMILEIPHAKAFDTIAEMVSVLNGAGPEMFLMGTTIRIVDTQVPDFWISGVLDDYVSYDYVDDDTLVSHFDNNSRLQIGYYQISKAEVGKIVLDDYLKKQYPEFDAGATRGYVYFIDPNHNQIVKKVQIQANQDTIPLRNPNGNFYVGAPTLPYECANVQTITALTGTTAPTTATKALFIGQFYYDTTNNKTYQCVAIDTTNRTYTWVQIIRSTDYAGNSVKGVVDVRRAFGLDIDQYARIQISKATNAEITAKTSDYHPIVPSSVDFAVKTGLTTNALEWTEEEKTNARTLFDAVGKTDYAVDNGNAGIVKTIGTTYGVRTSTNGLLFIDGASKPQILDKGTAFKPITPNNLDYAVKVGMTTNTEEWTEDEKTSARNLINAVGNEDYATTEKAGIVKINNYAGIRIDASNNTLYLDTANATEIKNKSGTCALKVSQVDVGVLSGLAYSQLEWTDEEKASARELLGLENVLTTDSYQEITGDKVFIDNIYIKNSADDTIDRIAHLGNQFTIFSQNGTENQAIFHIDKQLGTVSAYDGEKLSGLAFKHDVVDAVGTKIYVGDDNEPLESVRFTTDPQEQLSNVSNPNLLINGDFGINQRGQSEYADVGYTVDRWYKNGQTRLTINADKSITLTRGTTTQNRYILQWLENCETLVGKTITISAKVKNVNAGFPYQIGIYNGTEVVSVTGNYSGGEEIIKATIVVPSSWTKMGVIFYPNEQLTANTSATIEYVKAEIGEIATPFSPRPYAEELEMCRRYYIKLKNLSAGNYTQIGTGLVYSSTRVFISCPCKMRTNPTMTKSGNFALLMAGGYKTFTNISVDTSSSQVGIGLFIDITGGTLTAGQAVILSSYADGSAYIEFDAEIYGV